MVAGYDAQKNKDRGGKSFGAFAASMDGNFGRYYSRAMFHEGHEEISQFIGQMTSEALRAYQKQNNKLPSRILFYRWVFLTYLGGVFFFIFVLILTLPLAHFCGAQ